MVTKSELLAREEGLGRVFDSSALNKKSKLDSPSITTADLRIQRMARGAEAIVRDLKHDVPSLFINPDLFHLR